jgi:phosphatidylglycerophosphatase A
MSALKKEHPTWHFALQHPAHFIALGCGTGLLKPAPGTWGSIFGWLSFNYGIALLNINTQGILIALSFIVGVWACGRAGKTFGVIDHGAWVWDEVIAMWLILYCLPKPASFTAQLCAFGLFRLFDIVKPPPIRQWDAQLKHGFGVMWDDIVAAFYTLLVIAIWTRLFI